MSVSLNFPHFFCFFAKIGPKHQVSILSNEIRPLEPIYPPTMIMTFKGEKNKNKYGSVRSQDTDPEGRIFQTFFSIPGNISQWIEINSEGAF